MDVNIEQKINEIGAKIDIIESISTALTDSLCGTNNLTKEDAYSFAYLLENKIGELKIKQENIIKELNI